MLNYWLHYSDGSYWFKTVDRMKAFKECQDAVLPVDIRINQHGTLVKIYCNLVDCENIFLKRKNNV